MFPVFAIFYRSDKVVLISVLKPPQLICRYFLPDDISTQCLSPVQNSSDFPCRLTEKTCLIAKIVSLQILSVFAFCAKGTALDDDTTCALYLRGLLGALFWRLKVFLSIR